MAFAKNLRFSKNLYQLGTGFYQSKQCIYQFQPNLLLNKSKFYLSVCRTEHILDLYLQAKSKIIKLWVNKSTTICIQKKIIY